MNHVVEISDHFWIIEENGVRSFLFEGDKKAMLVDTGFGTLQIRKLVAGLTDLQVFLVNTHTDKDHTGVSWQLPADGGYYSGDFAGCTGYACRKIAGAGTALADAM
ncbi:MAG: hypothetical protein NC300_12860 [Bacteroidales bacterium]|nr:hypothetical protein [Clostridium sp.]MCM1205026.1 hypothetical protein [Bacteroidales bacterium]